MHPVICTIGPLTVYSYGLMLVAAFMVATVLARQEARRRGIDPELIFNFSFTALLSGIIGARIFYIAEHIRYYLEYPREIFMLQQGGLSWFGGFTLAVICSSVYLKRKKQPIFKIIDLIVPFLALAQAIGRVGCLLNGCCYGKVSAGGIYFAVHGERLIPTQIYSSLLLLAIFIILRFLQDRPHRQGQVFLAYLLLYSVKRFFIEFWRADNPAVIAGLSLFQMISLAIFIFALAMIKKVTRG